MSESPIAHLPADLGRLAVALLSGGTGTATEAINKMIDDSVSIVKKPLELLNDEKTN